jgi:uncharacterized lipoprotein YehR (DUF1307 family)
MKKLWGILLASVMATSLAACGGKQNASSASSNETAAKAAETKAENSAKTNITEWVKGLNLKS